jgi:hypothetical protein
MTGSFDNKNSGAKILELSSPTEFFHKLISEAQSNQGISLTPNVEFYIVQLLSQYVSSTGQSFSNSLALTYAKAMESSHGDRMLLLKQIGDNALFISGFFREFFTRKCFDMSYYIGMGANAYGELSALTSKHGKSSKQAAQTYREMAKSFSQSVEVLLYVAKITFPENNDPSENLLNTYEAWLDTASTQLEEELRSQGITPIAIKKILQ